MRVFLGSLALVLLLPQCGGGAATGAEPQSAGDAAKGSSPASDGPNTSKRDGETEDASDRAASAADRSKGPLCDDGTCSRCGAGICPAGWYCDEKSGGACSWLTECAEKPTCACVTRVLGATCKCRDDNGAITVACD